MPCQEEQITVRGTAVQLLKGGRRDPLLYLHTALCRPRLQLGQDLYSRQSQPRGLVTCPERKARAATARVGWNSSLCNPKLRERSYRLSPAAHGKAYQAGIAGSQLVSLPGYGHVPPFEKPQETAAALVRFFAQ